MEPDFTNVQMPFIKSAELIYDEDTPSLLVEGIYDGLSCLFDIVDFAQISLTDESDESVVSCELSSDDSANFNCTCTDSVCDIFDRCDYRYEVFYKTIGQAQLIRPPPDQNFNPYNRIEGSYTHTTLQ